MCVLYVSFGSKVRPRTFGCVVKGSALLFVFRFILLSLAIFIHTGFFFGFFCFFLGFLKRSFIEINKTIYRIVEIKDIRNTFRVKRNEREESMVAMIIF